MADFGEEHRDWFVQLRGTPHYARLRERPVAYFCAEFALTDRMPTYAGGLGVLAGDVVREAADRALPMIAVGLFYNQGYLCVPRQDGSRVTEFCDRTDPSEIGLAPVVDAHGDRIIVHIPIQDRSIAVQAWRFDVSPADASGAVVPVYLMDTDLSQNTEADRTITQRLYVGDKETRLKQEVVLGIGGLRLIEALGVHPSLYHLNEGHSAFLTLELIRHQMAERKLGFDEAKQFARRRVVFTNHTLVPAGNEVYDNDLVSVTLGPYCQTLGAPIGDIVALGQIHESSVFSMTMLAMRMAGIVSGVSKLHAVKAKDVWTSHPMVGITNGVHVGTWDRLGGRDLSAPSAFWTAHQERKALLMKSIAAATGRRWGPDDLLLGWARRFTRYKRPLAILEDADRLRSLSGLGTPVRIIIAGHPHPRDEDGVAMLAELQAVTEGPMKDFVAYLPNYSMQEATELVSGCDVWLNTPVLGYEASGTSGMKAALNGVLPFSTRDGWVAEVDLFGIGWPVDSDRVGANLVDVLEKGILPLYGDRNAAGVPELWEQNMRRARAIVLGRFSATRMLREYSELLYA
jgi:starch phosphorylase